MCLSEPERALGRARSTERHADHHERRAPGGHERARDGVAIGGETASTYVLTASDPDNLGGNVGTLLAADVAGFATGPAVSAVLVGPFGIPAPFLVIAVLTAAFVPMLLRDWKSVV